MVHRIIPLLVFGCLLLQAAEGNKPFKATVESVDATARSIVVAISGDDGVVVKRTLALAEKARIRKGKEAIELADLAAGNEVKVKAKEGDDGSWTASMVAVVVPKPPKEPKPPREKEPKPAEEAEEADDTAPANALDVDAE